MKSIIKLLFLTFSLTSMTAVFGQCEITNASLQIESIDQSDLINQTNSDFLNPLVNHLDFTKNRIPISKVIFL